MPKPIFRPYWTTTDKETVKLYKGDVTETSYRLPTNSVQTVVTSPPYWGIRDYEGSELGGEETPQEFIDNLVRIFRHVRRVLKGDGTFWLNLGDTYVNGNLMGIPWRLALALQRDGWVLRNDIIWNKLDVVPEKATDRCTKSHEYLFLLTKSLKYYSNMDAIREEGRYNTSGIKDAWRSGNTDNSHKPEDTFTKDQHKEGRNKRTIWPVASARYSGSHSSTFPRKLIEPCILAGSREGDVVLDPFLGSGTTAVVAIEHGRKCWGIELNKKYLDKNAIPRIEGELMSKPETVSLVKSKKKAFKGGRSL